MSYFSRWVDRQLKKKGLTGCVMYIVKKYVKMTPSKIDDMAVAEVEAALKKFESL